MELAREGKMITTFDKNDNGLRSVSSMGRKCAGWSEWECYCIIIRSDRSMGQDLSPWEGAWCKVLHINTLITTANSKILAAHLLEEKQSFEDLGSHVSHLSSIIAPRSFFVCNVPLQLFLTCLRHCFVFRKM